LQLALVPVAGAIAAGNRAMLKPSELTPRTSALLAEEVGRRFDASELAVLTGNATLGAAFAATRFDHLFFTGSTAVGRQVARAAAENLVPVTLELGGKSPALIAPDADLDRTAPRLVAGKLFNAGQTCIAPDYAMVPVVLRDALVERIRSSVARFYPTLGSNPDYSAIVNERHAERLRQLVDDARERGASIVAIDPAGDAARASARKFAPTLILGATDDMAVMREEIFGPLLPIETYATLDDALARLAARPRPLAFYYFGEGAATRDRVLRETIAGGVTVNDTLYHFAHEALPFGGVGESGSGSYHGERSFETFSHMKGVFVQSRRSPAFMLWPPYGRAFERVLALLRRL
jgi:coniferyl-aldehyde dehydrogenase